jgi:hypothetical protein
MAPALIEDSLKAVADILGMFRTNTTIGFNGFTVDDAALVAAVAKALTAKSMTVYEPATLAMNLKPEESSFLTGFKGITEAIMNFQINMAEMQSQVQAINDALAAYLAAVEAAQANLEQTASEPSEPKAKAMKVKQKALDRTREADKTYLLSLLTLDGQDLDPGLANILKARSDRLLKRLTTLASAAATLSTSFGTLQTSLLKLTDTGGGHPFNPPASGGPQGQGRRPTGLCDPEREDVGHGRQCRDPNQFVHGRASAVHRWRHRNLHPLQD